MSSRTSDLQEEIDQVVWTIKRSNPHLAWALTSALQTIYDDPDTDDERLEQILQAISRHAVLDLLAETG